MLINEDGINADLRVDSFEFDTKLIQSLFKLIEVPSNELGLNTISLVWFPVMNTMSADSKRFKYVIVVYDYLSMAE